MEFPGDLAVKDSVLSLPWLRFNPCPGNFCMMKSGEGRKEAKQSKRKSPFGDHSDGELRPES